MSCLLAFMLSISNLLQEVNKNLTLAHLHT